MRAPRILVVEDDASLRTALIRGLRRGGYLASGADSVEAAIAAVEQGVDVALVDIELQNGSGYSVLRECARRGWCVPIVMISGTGNMDDVIQLFRGGAVDYLHRAGGAGAQRALCGLGIAAESRSEDVEEYGRRGPGGPRAGPGEAGCRRRCGLSRRAPPQRGRAGVASAVRGPGGGHGRSSGPGDDQPRYLARARVSWRQAPTRVGGVPEPVQAGRRRPDRRSS